MLDSETGKEERVTFGGTEEIMNGRTDWVYPEETGQSEAFWWSPDGEKIAYLQFDVRAEYKYPLLHEIDLDLLWLAGAVAYADRSVRRLRSRYWARELEINVPVHEPER